MNTYITAMEEIIESLDKAVTDGQDYAQYLPVKLDILTEACLNDIAIPCCNTIF